MLPHPANGRRINTDSYTRYRYGTKMSPRNHHVSFAESQRYVIDPANPRGALDDRVENRLHVSRRPADDSEHLGRCGLMFERLAQLGVPFLDFFEKPDVFDGNDSLIGKCLEKGNLLLRERTNFGAAN